MIGGFFDKGERERGEIQFFLREPVFFRLNNDSDKEVLKKLLSENKNLLVFDEISDQLKELIKLTHPSIRLSEEDFNRLIEIHLNGQLMEEYGVWVYYPWTNRLVHLLDEKEFIKVRTSRNQYKITPEEQELLQGKKIGVIGLSVGQSVSVTLAIERICGELRIADFDAIELSNLNRIRTGVHNLGLRKTVSVAREIAEIDPFLKVVCFDDGITEENIESFLTKDGKLDILIDECDGLDIKVLCRQKAKGFNIPVLMEASDRGTIDVERFDIEFNRPILHGFIDHLDVSKVKTLSTNEEKIPYLLAIAGGETISNRAKASMLEIGQTITTWPQLGSAVAYGGGITADVARRMLLGEFTGSGRFFIDLEELIAEKKIIPDPGSIKIPIRNKISDAEIESLINQVGLNEYPESILLDEMKVTEIVKAAIKAPSLSNEQPWVWKYSNSVLYLFFNSSDTPGFLDSNFNHSYIGLGAACENLVLKAHSFELDVLIRKFPLGTQSKLVAAISFYTIGTKKNVESSYHDSLEKFIIKRCTSHKIGDQSKIDHEVLDEIQDMVHRNKIVKLSIIEDRKLIDEISTIVANLDLIRLFDSSGYYDFIDSHKLNPETDLDLNIGVDTSILELPIGRIVELQMLKNRDVIQYLKKWEKGKGLERFTNAQMKSSSALGLLKISETSIDNYFELGRLMQDIWLLATKYNISLQPLMYATSLFNDVNNKESKKFSESDFKKIEILKGKFDSIFGIKNGECPVLLFRLFNADYPLKQSLRIPVEKVLFFGGNGSK